MCSTAVSDAGGLTPAERLGVLFDELSELAGQRNAIDGRIVEITAEIDAAGSWGATGARSVEALVAWKTGCSPGNARAVTAVARRSGSFPRCVQGMVEGWLSLDRVAVIARRAGEGSDAHYAALARCAGVTQLRTAVRLEPRPEPEPRREPERSVTRTGDDDQGGCWRVKLGRLDAAAFDAALRSHLDALMAQHKHDHDTGHDTGDDTGGRTPDGAPPLPTMADAFMRLVEAGWDAEAARRPHGQRTTVVVHLDVEAQIAALHTGPLLTDAERRYLGCDATCETWFERSGQPIGAGRTTRTISRRLRRALEHRDRCCVVPGCGATRGLHAHHLRHWEDGGATELDNLVLLCPYHHRAHHHGLITITGPATGPTVTDPAGRPLDPASLARPPKTPPPDVPPCPGPTGEHAQWWWYQPFQPNPPPADN